MTYRKKTLRTMSPTARKVARLVGEQVSIALRLKNLIPDLQRLDLNSRALEAAKSSGLVLSDTDAWGLFSAIIHGQQTGYFDTENKEWAEEMLNRIRKFREQFTPIRGEEGKEAHVVHDPVTNATTIE
jgi:hypothetical protein